MRLVCVVHRRSHDWEAICLDLDLAVQGGSWDEVLTTLNDSIRTYVETAMQETDPVRSRLLSRRTPFWTRARWRVQAAIYAATLINVIVP